MKRFFIPLAIGTIAILICFCSPYLNGSFAALLVLVLTPLAFIYGVYVYLILPYKLAKRGWEEEKRRMKKTGDETQKNDNTVA